MSREFAFTIWVKEDARDFDDVSNAVYEAGGDDTLVGELAGKPYVSFDREAETLEDALRSALRTIKAAGLEVVRCEIPADALALAVRA
jgi:hypothetical protein